MAAAEILLRHQVESTVSLGQDRRAGPPMSVGRVRRQGQHVGIFNYYRYQSW
jgi:hypothetical protein